MTVTIGKNLDNGMIALTFDSTGRIVRLSRDETVDFEQRMQFIKMEGKLVAQSESREVVVSPDNPFSLYMNPNITRNKLIRAMNVSNAVKEIIDTLIGDVLNLICTGHDNPNNLHSLMEKSADNIKGYHGQKVGLSDTVSREAISVYIKNKLNKSNYMKGNRGLELSLDFYEKL